MQGSQSIYQDKRDLHLLGLASSLFLTTINQRLIPLLLIFTIICYFATNKKANFFSENRSKSLFVLFPVVFYLLHCIGMLYSKNWEYGGFDLETKASFLIIPILFLFIRPLNQKQLMALALAFIFGCLVSSLYSFGKGLVSILILNKDLPLFGSYIFTNMHVGYYGMHLNFAIFCTVYLLFSEKVTNKGFKVLLSLSLLILIVTLVQTGSKNGIIILIVNALIGVSLFTIKTRRIKLGFLFLFAILTSIVIAFSISTLTRNRFIAIHQTLTSGVVKTYTYESNTARILVWDAAMDLISKNFLWGVGTGDVKDELFKIYEEKRYIGVLQQKFNSHNQFLQTFAALGIPGFISLISLLFYGLKLGAKKGYLPLLFLHLIIIVAATTESVFEVQAGILFYTLITPIIVFSRKEVISENE